MTTSIQREKIETMVSEIVKDSFHSQQILSLTNAVQGVIMSASLAVSAIGVALAMAKHLNQKHAVKQVDRFFSNTKIKLVTFFLVWVPHIIGIRQKIVVSLDWTEFAKDGQSTLCLNLITGHGRATPLLWKTYLKSTLKNNRQKYEEEILYLLKSLMPVSCQQIIILADRGFGDVGFYKYIVSIGFDFVIRFKGNTNVTINGVTKPAEEWLKKGKIAHYRGAAITLQQYTVSSFVAVHDKGMKDAWYLASSLGDSWGREIISLYGSRFTCEESFRDIKDIRFGMGLSNTHISNPQRRDRILMVSAMATTLLTVLGAAGEALGLDRMLKVNTVKRRTHSLFTQGCIYFQAMINYPMEKLKNLMEKYTELLEEHALFQGIFSIL